MAKKTEIEYCGDCELLATSPRTGITASVNDHWCTGLPGAYREGIEALGRYPGEWLGFLPVVSEKCPKKELGPVEGA